MSFDPTKPQPWDIYSYKVRPGFTGSNAPIDRDCLHAQSLGIADWSPSDSDFCEAQAQVGREYATLTAVAETPTCDCGGSGCAKCSNAGFYRPENAQTGFLLRKAATAGGVADYDAIVTRSARGEFAIMPKSIIAREWFSIHYAGHQTARGEFVFETNEVSELMATRARQVPLTFYKGY